MVTADDVHYGIPVSLGTPAQSLYLTVDFEQYLSLLVSGVAVPVHSKRSFFNRSASSTFHETASSRVRVMGSDRTEFDDSEAYDARNLQVLTDVDKTRQLYDQQPFDGLIGPYVIFDISGALLYTFDVRRTCTSGHNETAGTLLYGAYDTAGCEEFSQVPITPFTGPGVACTQVTYFTITNVKAGSMSAESSTSMSWAITLNKEDISLPPALFEPIQAVYNATLANGSRYVVKCDVEYPPVTLTINGSYHLTIDYWNMVYRLNDVCYLRAMSYRLADATDDCGMYYIGIPLFHQYCLALNLYGPQGDSLKVARKRNVNASICTYVSVTTTAFPTTAIGSGTTFGAHTPLTGLSAGFIAAVVVACLVTFCSITAGCWFGCRHREAISRFGFLLAFSESRHRSKTEKRFPPSRSRTGQFGDDKRPIGDDWLISGDELQFDREEVLGTGHFSTVFKGALKNWPLVGYGNKKASSSFVVAVKVPNEGPSADSDDIWREIQRHKELKNHVHVVQMLCYRAANPLRPIIVLEYCAEGDLLKWLHRQRDRAEQCVSSDLHRFDNATYLKQQISVTWQISDGMTFVGSHGILHRDLAARNILLTEGLVAKIGDFGLARSARDNVYPNKTFGRLPVKRMAPESLKSGCFSSKSDVWSFGLLIYEIFSSGEEPFADVEPEGMLAAIEDGVRPLKPEQCPDEMHTIAQDCCMLDPETRPTFHTLRDALACFLEKTVAHDGYLIFGTQAETITDFADESTPLEVV